MKNQSLISFIILLGFISIAPTVCAQQKPKEWDLRSCINYALENNIQIKMQQQSVEIGKVTFEQSKAEKLPNLNGGIGQSFTNQMAATGSSQEQSFTGNYSLQSEMVLYNGNKLNNAISQNELLVKSGELTVKEAENNMAVSYTHLIKSSPTYI